MQNVLFVKGLKVFNIILMILEAFNKNLKIYVVFKRRYENFGSNKKYTYEVAKLFLKLDMLWNTADIECKCYKEDLFIKIMDVHQ